MTETHTLPSLAKTAYGYELQRHENAMNAIGIQTAEAMGLDPKLDYAVNFDLGTITREIPDPPKEDDPAPPSES